MVRALSTHLSTHVSVSSQSDDCDVHPHAEDTYGYILDADSESAWGTVVFRSLTAHLTLTRRPLALPGRLLGLTPGYNGDPMMLAVASGVYGDPNVEAGSMYTLQAWTHRDETVKTKGSRTTRH